MIGKFIANYNLWSKLRAADQIIIIYQLIISLIIILHFNAVAYPAAFLLFHLTVIVFLLYLPRFPSGPPVEWLKVWNPVIIIPLNFFELYHLVHPVNPHDLDPLFIKIDYWLFGVHPTVWLEKLHHPLLTEYLQVVYASFYFLPLILIALLRRRQQHRQYDFFIFAAVFCLYLCYIGYFLFPAIGPRFTIDHLQTHPLHGVWLAADINHLLNTLERVQRDAFPSGHTAVTLLTMYYAAKYQRTFFIIMLVIGSSLIFSTVYLRYHYVIDVIAGAVLAVLVIWVAPWIYGRIGVKDKKG